MSKAKTMIIVKKRRNHKIYTKGIKLEQIQIARVGTVQENKIQEEINPNI